MKEILDYLKNCSVFYIATVEGDQPRVRPFGAVAEFEGKLYLTTNNQKPVFKQITANPKIEISAMSKDNTWIRITAKAVCDPRVEARECALEANPGLKNMYKADDGLFEVLYLEDATAVFASFSGEPRTVKF